MAKIEKKEQKAKKLQERITHLEDELRLSLQKKASGTAIDVPKYTREIQKLKLELLQMR